MQDTKQKINENWDMILREIETRHISIGTQRALENIKLVYSQKDDVLIQKNDLNWKIERNCNQYDIYLGPYFTGQHLTLRERQVLVYIVDHTYKDIAEIMNLSKRTIEAYANKLKHKFFCKSKKELVKFIYNNNLLNYIVDSGLY